MSAVRGLALTPGRSSLTGGEHMAGGQTAGVSEPELDPVTDAVSRFRQIRVYCSVFVSLPRPDDERSSCFPGLRLWFLRLSAGRFKAA